MEPMSMGLGGIQGGPWQWGCLLNMETGAGKETLSVNREDKQRAVEVLRDRFAKSNVAVLTRFSGLKVSELGELRRGLKKISVDYHVVKNTLVRRAMEGTDVALLREHIRGPIAIALGEGDIVSLAKALTGYMKEHPKFQIEAGVVGGRVLDARAVEEAATLPSREELVAKLMFLLNAPVAGLMAVMREIPGKLVRTLDAIRQQKQSAG